MVGIELSSPPPLKPSHCASPPLHNSPFVRAGQQPTCRLLLCSTGPLLVGATAPSLWLTTTKPGQGPIRGQSPELTPHFRVFALTFTTPLNTHSAERSWGLAQGERVGKGTEKDMLSRMRFVCKVPSWLSGWLLRLDTMGPLIQSLAVLFCDCGHFFFFARSINRGIHHCLHHHHYHPRQHHMMAWCCFAPLHSLVFQWMMLIS